MEGGRLFLTPEGEPDNSCGPEPPLVHGVGEERAVPIRNYQRRWYRPGSLKQRGAPDLTPWQRSETQSLCSGLVVHTRYCRARWTTLPAVVWLTQTAFALPFPVFDILPALLQRGTLAKFRVVAQIATGLPAAPYPLPLTKATDLELAHAVKDAWVMPGQMLAPDTSGAGKFVMGSFHCSLPPVSESGQKGAEGHMQESDSTGTNGGPRRPVVPCPRNRITSCHLRSFRMEDEFPTVGCPSLLTAAGLEATCSGADPGSLRSVDSGSREGFACGAADLRG